MSQNRAHTNYVAANAEPFRKYGARFLVRAGQFQNPEGTSLFVPAEFQPI